MMETPMKENDRNTYGNRIRATPDSLPLYMRATVSSSKSRTTKRNTKDRTPRNKWLYQGEGSGKLYSGQGDFLDSKKLAYSMNGRTDRFNCQSSYLVKQKGHGSNKFHSSHKDMTSSSQTSCSSGFRKNKHSRFSMATSYLQKPATTSGLEISHGSMLGNNNYLKSGFSKTTKPQGRDVWLQPSDKDKLRCTGYSHTCDARSDFAEPSEDGVAKSAVFKDTTARFQEKEMEQGSQNLGEVVSDFESQIKHKQKNTIVYSKPKHSRFSEVGSIYQQAMNSKSYAKPEQPPRQRFNTSYVAEAFGKVNLSCIGENEASVILEESDSDAE